MEKKILMESKKITLIKLNLTGIPSYVINVSKIPKHKATQTDNINGDSFGEIISRSMKKMNNISSCLEENLSAQV